MKALATALGWRSGGDGKLDLYVQVGYHYNSTQRKLFLSSQAKKGKLVREVADWRLGLLTEL